MVYMLCYAYFVFLTCCIWAFDITLTWIRASVKNLGRQHWSAVWPTYVWSEICHVTSHTSLVFSLQSSFVSQTFSGSIKPRVWWLLTVFRDCCIYDKTSLSMQYTSIMHWQTECLGFRDDLFVTDRLDMQRNTHSAIGFTRDWRSSAERVTVCRLACLPCLWHANRR